MGTEQESSPELQAAREDALRRYKEDVRESIESIMLSPVTRRERQRQQPQRSEDEKKDERKRIKAECLKLGFTEEQLEDAADDARAEAGFVPTAPEALARERDRRLAGRTTKIKA